jgi:phosphate:Na+ symporter
MGGALQNFSVPGVLITGLALFVYGMSQLESGVRALGYKSFKQALSRSTASPVSSAGVGVAVTAVLQSSSMVSLLVLAFASAGVLPLYNAIGIILGANLGTTFTGWLVATIGFKFALTPLALPLMALGGVLQLVSNRPAGAKGMGTALFGFGMLIFGLDMMKGSVAELPQHWPLDAFKGHGSWVYFCVGAAAAALIQSSSATLMLTLTALHGGLLELPAAAALVIGADLGTTSTTALGSIGGHYVKRQLALAHIIFNVVVDLSAFFILLPALPRLLGIVGDIQPIYALVGFHSLFNLLGLLLFLPFLKPFSHWVGRRFVDASPIQRTLHLQSTTVPEAALAAVAGVLASIRLDAVVLVLHAFRLRPEQLSLTTDVANALGDSFGSRISSEQRYATVKEQEADLLAFSVRLQQQPLEPAQVEHLTRHMREARALTYGTKTIKDIRENLVAMRHSETPAVQDLHHRHRQLIKSLYNRLLPVTNSSGVTSLDREAIAELLRANQQHYEAANESVRELLVNVGVSGTELSTILNVNRDIHHAVKDWLQALE